MADLLGVGNRFTTGTPRVLVVEDSETIREMVGEALAEAGYHTDTRRDGDELEEALDGLRPDLVVLDVMLPGRDGFALIDVIRELGDIGIVLITARDALQDRLRGLDGGAIHLDVAVSDGAARVSVTDTGPGVPDDERERIFERLVRLDAGRAVDHGGAGLGLPIARALARAHGGDLVCLPHEGGAQFLLSLPVAG